jgi:hypothetical protein
MWPCSAVVVGGTENRDVHLGGFQAVGLASGSVCSHAILLDIGWMACRVHAAAAAAAVYKIVDQHSHMGSLEGLTTAMHSETDWAKSEGVAAQPGWQQHY